MRRTRSVARTDPLHPSTNLMALMAPFAIVRRTLLGVFAAALFPVALLAQDSAVTAPVYDTVMTAAAEAAPHAGGEANLKLPDLGAVSFLGGTSGRTLLMGGLVVCV